ncbi:MAG: CotH kinase family protein [Bacteroides sp.]|nr:CotH kinase family protein [Prevotella sp.]MCM1408249.1 CotH kinase family protein [Treponema brennaborense]MCM1469573.1 CotH kinase family protein [Bacteroides sp.]
MSIGSYVRNNVNRHFAKKNTIMLAAKKCMYAAVAAILLVSCGNETEYAPEIPTGSENDIEPDPVVEEKVHDYRHYNLESTGLPIVFIETQDGEDITSKENWVSVAISIQDGEKTQTYAAQMKGRGNSSWGQPKKPYSIKLDSREKVLGMKKHKRWVLVANYSDKTLLRNDWASYIGNEIFTGMKWNPSFEAVEVVLNGEYKGSYLIGEQIKIDKNRVDIPDISEFSGKKIENGGFICEVNQQMDEAFNFETTHGVCISLKDPDEVSEEIQNFVRETVQAAEDAIFSENFADEEEGYAKYIDVSSFIDWYLVNELTKNNDAIFFSSVYFYYDPDAKKLFMGPDWDFDISCGNINYNGCDEPEGFWIKNAAWYAQLFEDENFQAKLKARWQEVRADVVQAASEVIDEKAGKLEKSAEANFTRWPILGSYVWPNAAGYESRTTYQSEVDYLKDWLSKRIDWLDSQL